MQIFLGGEGLDKTHQSPFEAVVPCHICNGEARIMFVGIEGIQENADTSGYVCQLHENSNEGPYWPHDAIAVAVYCCRECFAVTAVMNQA